MKALSLSVAALCLAVLGPLVPAAAQDAQYYVDVATGSDANPGTSPDAAWKTLSHALTVAVNELDTIHVAPGDYSAATGEVFPLPLGNALVSGTQGPAVTRVIGSGTDTLFEVQFSGGWNLFRIEGLGLLGGETGVRTLSTANPMCVVLFNLDVVDMAGFGLDFAAHPDGGDGTAPSVQALIEDVTILDCGGGVRLSSSSSQASVLIGTRCLIQGNQGTGVHLQSLAGATLSTSWFESRLLGQNGAALLAEASGFTQIGLASTLVAGNATGLEVENDGGELLLEVFYSTLVDQAGAAVHVGEGMPAVSEFEGALLWGNGADVTGGVLVDAKVSDSEHGSFGTSNGNFSADPQFRNALAGDYRLSFGSPCIDAGDPGLISTASDLDGAQRPSDGDLDTIERLDVGAIEFAPLVVATTGELGTEVVFESYGMPCMLTTAWFAAFGPQFPKKTAFGNLRLDLGTLQPLFVSIVLSPDPVLVVATIPHEPLLVGATFSFQSLTSSLVAPKTFALTNVESFTLLE